MRARAARSADASSLAQIHVATWQHAYRHIFPAEFLDGLDVERRVAWFTERIGAGELILAGDDAEGVAGFCYAGPAREDEGWGEVYAIYVHPRAWGTGLGHDLFFRAEGELRGAGHERALLWVLEDNPRARAFYESHGWELSDRTVKAEIGGVTVTEVCYVKDPLG